MKVKVNNDFVIQNVAGENILIGSGEQINFSKMIIINETATYIIQALQKRPCTSDELAQLLCKEYDVDFSEALVDVEELLDQLKEQGVVSYDISSR